MSHRDDVLAVLDDWEGHWLSTADVTMILESDGYFERQNLTVHRKTSYVFRWLSKLLRDGKVEKRSDGSGYGHPAMWRILPEYAS